MKFRAEALEDDLPPASKRAHHRIQELTQELDRTITEVRRISSNLRPSALDDFGLVAALRMLCKGFEGLHDLRTEFHHQGVPGDRLDPSVEIAFYRIAQEALSNVSKHAGASTVTLRLVQEEKSLRLVISDNGKGFDPVAVERSRSTGRSFGLISMRERTELLGGSFYAESVAGQGTTVTATLPLGGLADDEEDQDPDRG
jgi:signal transduction histidine kinase